MAITDIRQYVHLTAADIEELGRELDAIRTDIEESRGERDARYVRRTIQLQRALVVGGRIALLASRNKVAWVAGSALLGIAKIIENLELGHNIMHGQWDWMNDPEIHSTEWEWDTTAPSVQWKHSHNLVHHKYTNIVGMDDDVGYGLLRVTRDQRWHGFTFGNAVFNLLLGHFPDDAEKFTREEYENETHPDWYLRQMLGSANFTAGPLMAFMSGNLCYQIEHHLFPDLPSNRYAEISERVKPLCDKYDLPYTTGSLMHQYLQTFWTIVKLSVPNKFLQATSDDAPETHSELKFRIREGVRESFGVDPGTGRRRGLRTALRELQTADVATA
jgi:fatty acid desaturase